MTTDVLATLAAANPVPDMPPVEPPERLLGLIEHELPPKIAAKRSVSGKLHGRLAGAALAAVLGSLLVLLLSNGPKNSSLHVAAFAYAATSPGDGVIEAVFSEHFFGFSRGQVRLAIKPWKYREWIDASAGKRRVQQLLPGRVEVETATTPERIEAWERASSHVIRRFVYRPRSGRGRALPLLPKDLAGGTTHAGEGLAPYRRLYRQGSIKLVGRERYKGRLLWKLEGVDAAAYYNANGKMKPIGGLVVLVDPKTYLPVVQRQVNLLKPAHPITSETALLGYRRLRDASDAILELPTLHPEAHLITKTIPAPGA